MPRKNSKGRNMKRLSRPKKRALKKKLNKPKSSGLQYPYNR